MTRGTLVLDKGQDDPYKQAEPAAQPPVQPGEHLFEACAQGRSLHTLQLHTHATAGTALLRKFSIRMYTLISSTQSGKTIEIQLMKPMLSRSSSASA